MFSTRSIIFTTTEQKKLFNGIAFTIHSSNQVAKDELQLLIERHGGVFVRHSQSKKIWGQRVHRLGATIDRLVILVDPSRVDTDQECGHNTELCFDREDLHMWSINWGFVQYCIDEGRVTPTAAARRFLLLNCTIDLKGWAFAFAANLSPTERKRYTSLITRHGGRVVEAAEHTDIILVAHSESDIDVMAAYRTVFAYACVEPFRWLDDIIFHRDHLRFTTPRNVITLNGHRIINSRTNHQPKVRKNTSFTLNDDRRLKQYLEGRVLKGYTLGSSSIYKKLVCKDKRWVKRHSWATWMARYRQRRHEYDAWFSWRRRCRINEWRMKKMADRDMEVGCEDL